MPVRQAEAVWEGDLKAGKGNIKLQSGAFQGAYSFGTRFEGRPGTNPEELIGAAEAACYSMALSAGLGKDGITPKRIHTTAKVHIEQVGDGFKITRIQLRCEAEVPGIDDAKFQAAAEATKKGCPVSQALAGTNIELEAVLVK